MFIFAHTGITLGSRSPFRKLRYIADRLNWRRLPRLSELEPKVKPQKSYFRFPR
jgi:hypothetical protein